MLLDLPQLTFLGPGCQCFGEEGKVWKVEKVGKARKAGKVKHKMAALSLFFVGNLSEELHGLK
jgi:hypothetical protein